MAAIAQTIAIVDRSGKVVSTSKQLKNVFKEAKYAYLDRKAEIAAQRKAREDRELQKAIAAMAIAEEEAYRTGARQRRDSRRSPESSARRPTGDRHLSSSSIRRGTGSISSHQPRAHHSRSPSHSPRCEDDYYNHPRSAPVSPSDHDAPQDLIRRHTDMDLALDHPRQHTLMRSYSEPITVDMDLAYGEYNPEPTDALYREPKPEPKELNSLVSKVKLLLDEANCAHASVTAVVAHLQKNPDAMAAVALTLAEISNIASKMAPGALTALKGSAPAVFALLASPQFLIAAGVGIGVTVVMFGGYKIIKKIKEKHSEKEESVDEMLEIGGDVESIEHWRRGIADADCSSVYSGATSVEGEFITPVAAASRRDLPATAVHPRTEEVKGTKKEKRRKKTKGERSEGSHSRRGGSSSKGGSASGTESERNRKALVKVSKPSPLRRLFDRD